MKKHFNKIVSGTVFTLLLGSGVVFAQNVQIEKTEEAINEGVTISSNDLANNHSKIYKDEIISAADLPKEIKKYMSKHFPRSEEHTSELQSRPHLVCRLLLEKKKKIKKKYEQNKNK